MNTVFGLLADPSQPLIESPGALHVGDTQGDQVDPLLHGPKLPRHEETKWKPGRGAQPHASSARIVLPKPGRYVGVPGADRYRPSDTVRPDLLPMGPVHFRGPEDTSTQRLLELHDYGVETRGEVGAVRWARGRANTGGARSGSQTEVLPRRGRLPRRRPG